MSDRLAAIVPPEHDGERLDRALAALFPDHSRSALARLIEEGHVRLDTNEVGKTSLRVSAGQQIDVEFPSPVPSSAAPEDLPLNVLFEDADLAVIDKPAGDRKSTRLNSSHVSESRMPSSA